MYHRQKRQSKLGSYPIIHVAFSTMWALLVVGLFGLLLLHAHKLTSLVKENVKVQVYLHKNISERVTIRMSQLLSKQDFVYKKNGCAQVAFYSKEEIAETFVQATGEPFWQVLDENPLRDVYIVSIAPGHQHSAQLQVIKEKIAALPGVFDVDYVEDFVTSINDNITKIGAALAIFAIILLIVVAVLINNTIRLAIYSQRLLIRSMNLVGATAAFIRRPFLARSVLIGLMAGTVADLLLLSLLHLANQQIEVLVRLQEPVSIFLLLGFILFLGVFISFVGTYRAASKYLSMSLEDLY